MYIINFVCFIVLFLSIFGGGCVVCFLVGSIDWLKHNSELEQVRIKYYVNLLAYFTCLFFTCLTISYFINL